MLAGGGGAAFVELGFDYNWIHFEDPHPGPGRGDQTMFKSLFAKPLRLELDDRAVTFGAIGDFEFALASRTEVPAAKVGELVRLSPAELQREATSIREVERRFVEVLASSLEEPGSVGYLLREMDLKLFSQDHEWRAIMRGLVGQPGQFDEYKQIALVKYMQYLGSRQDVLSSMYANKVDFNATAIVAPDMPAEKFRETLIFDVVAPEMREDTVSRFERLPRGETVAVGVIGDRLEVILSRHRFSLLPGSPTLLCDDDGPEYELLDGRNVVGRLPESDVVVDAGYRDVSRKHLVVEVGSARQVLLTDLSSHGTFVPRGTLDIARRKQ